MTCLNCDHPTLLVNFGYLWTGLFNRSPRFTHACGMCFRITEDYDPARGGYVGFGLVVMAVSPLLAAWLRGTPPGLNRRG